MFCSRPQPRRRPLYCPVCALARQRAPCRVVGEGRQRPGVVSFRPGGSAQGGALGFSVVDEEELSDAQVLEASRADPGIFRVIFERHHGAVYRFAARRVGRDMAGDVAADTFVRALSGRHRYNTDHDNALPWLYGIASNVIGDHLRKRRRRARFLFPFRRGWDPTWESDDRLVASSLRDELKGALAELAETDRDTFLLYALEGLSYAEIAEALDIPVGTVGSRVFRVRRRIRQLIPDLEQRISIASQESDRNRDERD